MGKITLDTLRKNNCGYAYGASYLNEKDLEIVNNIIEKIEATRTDKPQSLDKIIYTDKYGCYFANAMLEENTYHDGKPCIVQSASAHIYLNDNNDIRFSSSGGSYDGGKDLRNFKYVGKAQRNFWTWSSLGAGAHQGIYFNAEVSEFIYNERPKELQHLTKEFLTMVYVSDAGEQPFNTDYRFTVRMGNYCSRAFKKQKELDSFLAEYRAIEEPRTGSQSKKYWILNPVDKYHFDTAEFAAANGREFVEWWNGKDRPHKVEIDGNNHITHIDRSAETIY